MRHRHDRLAKKLLRRTLESEGTFTPEMEVSPDAQRFDGYFIPSRAHVARKRDLLDRMTGRTCAFEAFRKAPSDGEIEACLRKLLTARHVIGLARPPGARPSQWLLCGGHPRRGLASAGAKPKRGFPRGVYDTPRVQHTGFVVLSQLPETPDTLILRLMSAGRTLRRALAELERLPEHAREREVALPVLLDYRAELAESPARSPEDEEFLMDTQNIVQRLKDEGRHETLQENLLTIYRARFGAVPRKVRAGVGRSRDDAALARWVELFAAGSAAEIAAALTAKKA